MLLVQRSLNRLAVVALCSLAFVSQVSALTIEYCSDINTASTPKNSSIFQSNGLCHNFCIAQYAFAVLQDDGCWCSNYAPATTTTGCTDACPGYPYDLCGGSGVYGYIALDKSPSGTEGANAAASMTATDPAQVTVTAEPETILQTVTEIPIPISTSTSSVKTSSSSSTTLVTSTSPTQSTTSPTTDSHDLTSSTWTPTAVISIYTTTGQAFTVTITPTVPPNAASTTEVQKTSRAGGGLSTGAAVGLTIGLVALVAIISSIIYFCIKKRNEQKAQELLDNSRRNSTVGLGGPVPSRTMSENSRYVLGTDGRQVVEGWEVEDTPGSRRSKLMPVDPRLDPFAPVYQRNDNKSRESINTIRDDLDYSRRIGTGPTILRATNPDPDSTVP